VQPVQSAQYNGGPGYLAYNGVPGQSPYNAALYNGDHGQEVLRGASYTRFDLYGGTGRVGYNNTPQPDRKSSFSRGLSQPDFYSNRESSPLPRSNSAFENRSTKKPQLNSPIENRVAKTKPHVDQNFDQQSKEKLKLGSARREYDAYSHQDDLYIEEEPIYVPRSIMADIISKNEDDLVRRRHRPEDLIELPSGARQKRTRIFSESLKSDHSDKMEGMRHRHSKSRIAAAASADQGGIHRGQSAGNTQTTSPDTKDFLSQVNLKAINRVIGLAVILILAYKYQDFLFQLHENEMWFSEITELEREISFRTEAGLYYSYFKQLVSAPSLQQGLRELREDNITESNRTINIIQRFNVHQEIFLTILYKFYNFNLRPIFFYIYFVFSLQGLFLCALYLISWSLSGSWLSGVLTVVYVFMNRVDVTRVHFTVPLREHFSLPFIFLQFYTVGTYLREGTSFQMVRIYIFTVIFTLTWQFGQFICLLQCLAMFGLATFGLLNKDKVCRIMGTVLASILTVWYLQFYQPMVISSLVFSFIPVAVLSLQSEVEATGQRGIRRNLGLSVVRIFFAVAVTIGLNIVMKLLLRQTADNHIFRFLKNKIVEDHSDFETRLYLCDDAFQWLDSAFYIRLTNSSILPLYLIYTAACLIAYLSVVINRWKTDAVKETPQCKDPRPRTNHTKSPVYAVPNGTPHIPAAVDVVSPDQANKTSLFNLDQRPDLCFHIGQSVVLGLMAISTLRMKCFWTPYMSILSGVAVSDPDLWTILVNKIFTVKSAQLMNVMRNVVLFILVIYLGLKQQAQMKEQLEVLREFYDPDTVDLMQWIQQNTNKGDVMSGSMQLMAGVKLCTGRALTNHPHFEDQHLRERTKELYQMYGKLSPEAVYDLLKKYKTDYIILEDSICLAHHGRCSTPDIIDLVNKHIPEDGIRDPPYLVESEHPRFCDEVRYDTLSYRRLFKRVFENKTFRIYKLK